MKVVLAEKPSVARDIAAALGATNKKDGYFEGNGYAVTYAFGHLVTIAEPEEMDSAWGKPWTLEQLPMIPTKWKYRIADKAGPQFKIIKSLFLNKQTTRIICATDAGREGEHIFRLIYSLSGSKLPVERLWISSLTAEAIKEGFKRLKPSKEFDNLAAAATGRAHADWKVGLNFTRAYTVLNKQLCTIGRVQTPTLSMIVDRQKAIDNFKSEPFFEILATFEPGFETRYITKEAEPQTKLKDKAQAQRILSEVMPVSKGLVQEVQTTEKRTKPPALYDLLTLQKDANRRFGYTAQETLDIAQSLYEEHKLLSYPRTESRHLSTDMVEELPRILSTVLRAPTTSENVRNVFAGQSIVPGNITSSLLRQRLSKAYVDDTKLTDHHAIIPTPKMPPAELPTKQRNIYDLVATRFMSIFLPEQVRDETTVLISLAGHCFRAKGVVIKKPGWTVLQSKTEEKESSEDSQKLPPLAKGEQVAKRKAELSEGKTSPPKPFDDASLLTAMKNAGQELDDEDLASYMKQSGLGTPATRAAIIERLIQSGYVERSKKALLPTSKGKALIDQVHVDLKNIALTASWEQKLRDIQDGKQSLSQFEGRITGFIFEVLVKVIQNADVIPVPAEDALGPCPQCKQGTVRKTPKGAGCNRWKDGCNFTIWREQYGKKLTETQIEELVTKRRTKVIKGFKKKDGSGTYDARLVLNDEFKIRLEFDNTGKR